MSEQPTPRPWTGDFISIWRENKMICNPADGRAYGISPDECSANQQLILNAVNSYDALKQINAELVAAIQRALPYVVSHRWENVPRELQKEDNRLQVETMDLIKQALRRAEAVNKEEK